MAREVDTRVVEMQFDNKNFERNVSTSLSTLDRLKKALRLDDGSKGFEKVDNAASKLNFDKLISAATALEKRFSFFGEVGAAAIHRVTNSMIDLSTKTLSFITSGITQGGIKRAMNLEQANFQLQGLLKNGEAVAAVMEDVNWSVDGTAYGLDAAAKAASMFAATGMRAGDQMKGALRGVAGVAAMTNSQYEDIAMIFTTVAGQGKVMADQYNQLASRGLNAAATIADYLTKVGNGAKVTEAQVREMTSQGKIDFATFAAAMDDAFGEHAKAANKTFNGAMSNIRAALARIGADFVSPLIKQDRELVWLLNHIRLKINDIRKQTTPFAQSTTKWLNDLLYKMALFVKSLDFSYNSTTIRVVKTNFESLMNVITAIKQVLLAVGAGFKEAFPESASNTLIMLSTRIRGLTERLIPSTKAFGNIRDTSRAFFTIVKDGAEVVKILADKALSLLSMVLDKVNIEISDIPGGIARAILAFKDMSNGANIFLAPIGALSAALSFSRDKLGEWLDKFKQLPRVQSAIEKFNEIIAPFQEFVKNIGDDAKGSLGKLIDSFKSLDGVSFESTKGLLQSFRDILKGGFVDLWNSVKEFPSLLGGLKDAIGEQLNNIGSVFSTFWTYIKKGFGSVIDFFADGKTIAGIVSAIFGYGLIKVIKGIKTNFLPIFTTLPKLIDAATGVLNQFETSLNQVTRGIMFEKIADGVYTIAKAIAVLAGTLVVLSQIDPQQLQNGGIALTMLAGGMAALVAAFAKLDSKGNVDIKGVAGTMIGMAVSVLLLTKAIKDIADMGDGVLKGIGVITILVGEMAAVAYLLSRNQGVLDKGQKQMTSSVSMLAFAFSIRTLVKVMEDISKMPLGDVMGSLTVLTILMAEMVAMTKLTSGGGWKSGVGMLALAASVHVLIGALEKIGDMDLGKLVKAELVMVSVAAILKLMSGALGAGGDNSAKSGIGLLAAAGSMLVIGYAIEKIGSLDVGTILKGLGAVTAIGLVFTAIIASTKYAGDNAAKVGVTLLAMSASIAILAGVITLLGSLDEKTVIQGTAAVSALMAMFALVIASTRLANDCKATLIIVTTAVTMLALAIGALSFVEPDRLQAASTALSMVMAMFGVVVASTGLAKKASGTIVVMGLVVAELAGILVALSLFDTEKMLPAAEALSLLMLSLSASFLIISKAGDVSLAAVGALAAMGLVVAELALILGAMQALHIEPSMETVTALSVLLLSMTAVLAALSLMHVDVGTATNAALALSSFVGILGGVMVALGALMEYVPGLENFLDKGIEVLIKIGEGLGRFVGAIIEGLLDQVIGGLPKMGANLSLFMTSIQPFIMGAKSIDSKVVDGVTHLAGAIIAISAAQVIQGITDLLPFTGSIEDFGKTLNTLGRAMVEYSSIVAGKIDAGSVVASATAAEALAALQNNLPRYGGALQDFLGEKMKLDEFGKKMEQFGYCLVRYSSAITSGDGINSDAIQASATAAQALTELQNNLPATGGVLQDWLGEKMNLDEFGRKMVAFGGCLVAYSAAITTGKGIDAKAITDSAKAGQMLADLQNSLPETDGVLQDWFGGKMDLATFGNQIVLFGMSLVNYCMALTVGGGLNTKAIAESAKAAKKLVELQNALPKESGWFQDFFGGGAKDMGVWGEQLVSFGNALSHYSAILAIGKGVNVALIQESVDAAKILMNLEESVPKDSWGPGTLVSFGNQLKDFGYAFSDATEAIVATEHFKLRLAIEDLEALIAVCTKMMVVNSSSMNQFAKGLKDLATNGIKEFVKKFDDSGTKVTKAINQFMDKANDAIKENQNGITKSIDDLLKAVLSKINNRQKDFKTAGNKLMENFISGLKDKKEPTKSMVKEILDYVLKTINGDYPNRFFTSGVSLMKKNISGFQDQKEPFNKNIVDIMNSGVKSITDQQTNYNNAADSIMTGFIKTVNNTKPKSDSAITDIVNSMTKIIGSKQGDFVNAGSNSMTSVSTGMNKNAPVITTSAVNAVNKAYNAIYGLGSKFYNTGSYYASGLANGIDAYAYKALASAKYLAEKMDRVVRNTLKINSPSKLAYESGGYYGEGIVLSLLDAAPKVTKAAENLAMAADKGISKAVDSAMWYVSEHLNLSPVITPKIDPSNALATASQLNALLNGGRTYSVSSEIRDGREAVLNQNRIPVGKTLPAVGNNYQFVQNNYSPESLSRIAIYRQTKNQFDQFKQFKEATAKA